MEKENQTEAGQQELESSILESVNGGKPETEVEEKKPEAKKTKEAESTEEESAEETTEESTEEDKSTEESTAEETEEASEEPDGKTKRIQELAAQKRRLEAELKKLQTQNTSTADPEMEKLEKMSTADLKALKREVQVAWKMEQDVEKSRKLLDLQDKIDSVVASAPARFNATQLSSFTNAVAVTQDEMGEEFTLEAQKAIYSRAKAVFDKYPSLQNSVDGQALAWEQAVDWYKESSKFNSTKAKASETNREMNKLKKKVSLDTATARGAQKETENSRLFKGAKAGDKKSAVDWVKNELNL